MGGDVNTVMNTPDATPLVVASVCQPDICRILLTNTNCKVNAVTAEGKSLLHAIFGGVQVGRVLSPEEQKEYNRLGVLRPQVKQARHTEVAIIQLTNMWRWNPHLDVSLKDANGTSVFHAACASENSTACVRALLKKKES